MIDFVVVLGAYFEGSSHSWKKKAKKTPSKRRGFLRFVI
uniref:Uncharacterized protein n=1 Tax=Escherichia coli TaxID=562 RepID=A0A7L8KA28_ECOLX|nr:hypothetical protein [Escherichia coli]UCK65637.1 hypothetical protein [Providencia rettgeri]